MRFRTKVFTLLLVVAVFAAFMAAFVTDGCRGFSGAGPLSFGGYPQMKSVTLVSHLYSHRKKVTALFADARWIYNLLNS